jgi:hypothetical protein
MIFNDNMEDILDCLRLFFSAIVYFDYLEFEIVNPANY